MNDEERQARIDELLDAERQNPLSWWWLSFADDEGFRGACLIHARGMIGAVRWTHRLGISPGGEVRAVQLPPEAAPDPAWCNRLLSLADVEAMPGGALRWPG